MMNYPRILYEDKIILKYQDNLSLKFHEIDRQTIQPFHIRLKRDVGGVLSVDEE